MDIHELGFLLRRVSRTHHKLCHTKFYEHGLSNGQPPILRYLHDHDGCIQSEISRFFHLEPATITSNLTNMERDGLVERRPNPADRRVWQVFLTEKGQEAFRVLQEVDMEVLDACFDGFSEAEMEAASDMLRRISGNIRSALDAAPQNCDSQEGTNKNA